MGRRVKHGRQYVRHNFVSRILGVIERPLQGSYVKILMGNNLSFVFLIIVRNIWDGSQIWVIRQFKLRYHVRELVTLKHVSERPLRWFYIKIPISLDLFWVFFLLARTFLILSQALNFSKQEDINTNFQVSL